VIRALGSGREDGSRVLILGLSDENWARLRTGNQPIPIRVHDLDPSLPPLTVVIIGGPTEESIYEDLRANVQIRTVHHPEQTTSVRVTVREDPPP
jgi:hypothetical protein